MPESEKEKSKTTEQAEEEGWVLERVPQVLRIFDPKTKEIIAQGENEDELKFNLAIATAKFAKEAADTMR